MGKARDLAGKAVGVSGKMIDYAEKVHEHGVQEQVKASRQAMKNRGHSQRKAHALIEVLREDHQGGDDFEERYHCRRCRGSLAGGNWREIGPDTVTGRQVRVCEGCWRELQDGR